MNAVFLTGRGDPEKVLTLKSTVKPVPDEGQVLIQVEAFGLNFAEVMARQGLYRDALPLPFIPGYEVAGVVCGIGKNVATSWIGKRVVGFTRFGGYAEFALSPVAGIAEIGTTDAGVACAIGVQYATAWYMVEECLRLNAGEKILIHAAAGGVGTALVQICKRKGCEVFATVGSDEKIAFVCSLGADHVVNHRKQNYAEVIRKQTGGKKLIAVFNAIGGKTFKQDLGLVGAGGKVVIFGGAERTGKSWGIFSSLRFVWRMGLVLPIVLMMTSKSIIGVNMLKIGDERPEILNRCLNAVAKLVISGELNPHIGGRFAVNDIAKAHRLLESRTSIGKIVVYWPEK